MIRWCAALVRLDVGKAQFIQIDNIYKRINNPDHIILADHFIKWSREKAKLLAVLSGSVCHVGFSLLEQDKSVQPIGKEDQGLFSQSDVSMGEECALSATFRPCIVQCFIIYLIPKQI